MLAAGVAARSNAFPQCWYSRKDGPSGRSPAPSHVRWELVGTLDRWQEQRTPRSFRFLRVLDFRLQRVDLHPGAQSWSHRAQVKLLHEDEVAIYAQQRLAVNVLISEHIAVLLLHAHIFEVLGDACRRPCLDLLLCVPVLLLLVRFLPVDV